MSATTAEGAPGDGADSAAPLAVWAAALLGCVLVAVGVMQLPSTTSATQSMDHGRIEAFAALASPDEKTVVLLGDSRLIMATETAATLAARLTAQVGAPTRVLNLASPGADFGYYGPLSEAILALEPSLVVAQLELLNDSAPVGLFGPLQPVGTEIRDRIWRLRNLDPLGKRLALQNKAADPRRDAACEDPAQKLPQYVKWLKDEMGRDGKAHASGTALFSALCARGLGAAHLRLAWHPEARAAIPDADGSGLRLRARQLQQRCPAAIAFTYDGQPAADEFCDPGHYNGQGRKRFSDWLVSRIAAQLRAVEGTPR